MSESIKPIVRLPPTKKAGPIKPEPVLPSTTSLPAGSILGKRPAEKQLERCTPPSAWQPRFASSIPKPGIGATSDVSALGFVGTTELGKNVDPNSASAPFSIGQENGAQMSVFKPPKLFASAFPPQQSNSFTSMSSAFGSNSAWGNVDAVNGNQIHSLPFPAIASSSAFVRLASNVSPFGTISQLPQDVKKAAAENKNSSLDRMLDFGTKVTTVRVGSEHPQDFTVHENLLKRSPFFSNALTQIDDTFPTLKNCSVSTFQLYVNWLYTNRLHSKPTSESVSEVEQRNEWIRLTEAYILGEYLDDADFRDCIIDALLDLFEGIHPTARSAPLDNVQDIYKLADGSPLRELVSDIAAWHFDHDIVEEIKTRVHVPSAFLVETLVKLSKRFQNPSAELYGNVSPVVKGRRSCKYHCHAFEKTCYKG
ncbi:hypothetical protein P280DRAFT_215912 [Massarina eburnea CBS 473.64]|uniref:BTB domain-containing protein n=1 Tax=Massarina eburnea CBS 473.64 TaxID=1395130 RepID=A0A6A6SBE3_9PLEO|nr:hypothetical protein P280DRAFT_215912 [Massarina eburnea CBS 473.64]